MNGRTGRPLMVAAVLGLLLGCGSSAGEAPSQAEASEIVQPLESGGVAPMSEAETPDLASWDLERLASQLDESSRFAVVVLVVDRAEIRNVGSRSQSLLLGGRTIAVAAGAPPQIVNSLLYYARPEHPQPGDQVVAVLRGSRRAEETAWVIVRFQRAAADDAGGLAELVAERLRELVADDPFRPFADQ